MRVLTIGETMVLFDGVEGSGLVSGERFSVRIGGAESNFAVALRRLGVDVTWISRLGRDAFGSLVRSTLEAEGVDLDLVRDEDAPTGVFFKWHEHGENRVAYRRRGSAASRLTPGDLPEGVLEGIDLVHLTGITTAISVGARRTVVEAARRARGAGIPVTFDLNYRPALWPDPTAAAEAAREVLPYADWVLCGLDEGQAVFGAASPGELRAAVREAGADELVVRVGARGAVVWASGRELELPPARLEMVVDEIGAGDGFAAGFAFGLLNGMGPPACTRAGNVIAARALRGTGDWETYPRLADVYDELFDEP